MSCFACFKPEKKTPSTRTESREVTVVKKASSENEATPRESGKNHKMLLPLCRVHQAITSLFKAQAII